MAAKIAFHFSFAAEEKKKTKDHTPKVESHGQQELVQVERLEAKIRVEIEFTSWRQPKFARTLDQSRQEGDEIERGHKKIHGADERQESFMARESQGKSEKRR